MGTDFQKLIRNVIHTSELDHNTSYKLYGAEIKMKTSFFRILYHSSENLKKIFRIKWRMIFLSN